MLFSRGDILQALFPNSDLRTAKRLPVVVVQADDLKTSLPQVIVAMIPSNLARAGHPSRVAVSRADDDFSATGLLADSVVLTDNLATVIEAEIHRKIGRIADMDGVRVALRHTLGL